MKVRDIIEPMHEALGFGGRRNNAKKLLPITDEQRESILAYFPTQSTAREKIGGQYASNLNVHAVYGRGKLSFRNEAGKLKVGVSVFRNRDDASNPSVPPVLSYDYTVVGDTDMEKLIQDLQ